MRWMAVGSALTGLHYPLFSYLGAIDGYRVVVRLAMITAVLNFIASLMLVQRMGLMGVVWGTVVENAIWGLFLWPWMAKEVAGLSLKRYVKTVYFGSALPFAVIAAASSWFLFTKFHPSTYGQLLLCGLGTGAVMAMAAWFLLLDPEGRSRLRRGLF
jgi:peptidoglycan biosynthesis protein MviN/MurJ (putative lipid II flippase)